MENKHLKKIQIGIIGAGKIAETAHIPALVKCNNAELSVIIENNLERVNYLKKELGINIPHIGSLKQLQNKIDAVIICSPNNTHKELCLECFELGIHVLVEKPLANSYKDSLDIQRRANETGSILMTGYCTRFWPSVQFVKEIIDNKILGEVKKFVFQYGVAGGWSPVSNYIMSKKEAGGGAFVINGSHYLDRMLWFFGIPDSYTFYDDALEGLEANALAEFYFNSKANLFKGILRVSKTVNLDTGCYIECEKGIIMHKDWQPQPVSIKFLNLKSDEILVSKSDNFDKNKRPDMYLNQLEEFIGKIIDKNFIGVSDSKLAVENVRITEDLYKKRKPLNCNWYNK
jgi:predicted dehydrogenase